MSSTFKKTCKADLYGISGSSPHVPARNAIADWIKPRFMVAVETPHRKKRPRTRRGQAACRSEPSAPVPKGGARLIVRSSPDIVHARQVARDLAIDMGFPGSDVTRIASAISEIARNILDYAREGEIEFESIREGKAL